MASMLDTMESMALPPVSKVLPVSTPLTYPFPVPDANVVMLTPKLRLLPTTMEVTTAVMPDTLTTDTDTVWAVITVMDSTVWPPTPVPPPHLLPDLPKVLASKLESAILKKPQSYAKIYALYIQNASNNVPK